jgi:hypothetical protein
MRLGPVAPVAAFVVALGGVLAACGDDGAGPDLPGDLLTQLQALPGVHDVTEIDTVAAGYHYFVLHFEQPVDHDDPEGPTFLQKVSLMHRDAAAPMVEYTSGYWDYYNDNLVELTGLLDGNQVSIEHRYFDESRPDPADWSKLTIVQMAHDQHAITTALRTLYTGAFITAGASKGGMTAVYYKRFYPDDVDGTVPYVAPISFGAPDTRYTPFLDTLGPAPCRQAVRDAATEMLANRRAQLLSKAQEQATQGSIAYTRIAIGPALESSIISLEWAFWQYYGIGYCETVPAQTATDQELWDFLDDISPVADNADPRVAQFDAYYYQAYFQLGYPDSAAAYLDPYLMYTDADYAGALPTAQPAYDGGAAMNDIAQYVREAGDRLIFIYGEWDPWTGGKFDLGGAPDARDSLLVTQAEGTHGARIGRLAPADRDAVLAKLQAWTGVTPSLNAFRSTLPLRDDRPRLPPVMLRLSHRR